ncbi:uncharacterized protein LOC118202507 [Stegodyphus dumicola]|uniref:uncharacterized protein LOC118202507 n=1 Tax=Stegodyphus dumicola TaxID=202533 RepID=UPI0015AA0AF5|nr:uncharacterized protein LOC118202507 [Stegodyphus dumicola]
MLNDIVKHTWKRILSNHNSIFQAELTAINKAIQLSYTFDTQAHICSDILSSLKAIGGINSRNPLVAEIQKLLLNIMSEFRPRLSWVPAHTGIVGNDFADELAKQAATGLNLVEYPLPLPSSYLKRIIYKHLMNHWQSRWNIATTGRWTFRFCPHVPTKMLTYSSALTTFLSGHGPFITYLHRFAITELDTCDCGLQRTA